MEGISLASARGIGLISDMVINHAGFDAALTRTHPEWFRAYPACLSGDDTHVCLYGLPDFVHERPEVAAFTTGQTVRWMERFPVAGIRLDTTKHISLAYLRAEWVPKVRRARPEALLLAEVWDDHRVDRYVPYLIEDTLHTLGLERALWLVNFLDNHDTERLMTRAVHTEDPPRVIRRYRLALTTLMTLPGSERRDEAERLRLLSRGGTQPGDRRRQQRC